jgi:hypothetical protein
MFINMNINSYVSEYIYMNIHINSVSPYTKLATIDMGICISLYEYMYMYIRRYKYIYTHFYL